MSEAGQGLAMGVVGVGSHGFHHARILREIPGVEMVGVHDVRPERAREVAEELSVPRHETLTGLLDAVEALVVAVPTAQHEEVAQEAMARGVHVFIEKPIAPDLATADRIVEAANRHGVTLQVGHVERFNAAVREAEPYLDRPLFIECHRLAPFTPRGIDVAVVLDLMIHDVDLIRSLVGRPVENMDATGVPVLTPTVDIANARLTFADGAVANLTASRVSAEKMRKLRIFQRSGYLSLDLAKGEGQYLRLKGELPGFQNAGAGGNGEATLVEQMAKGGLADIVERIPIRGDGAEPLRRELESFRESVTGGTAPLVSGDDARAALGVALEIEERINRHVAHTRPS